MTHLSRRAVVGLLIAAAPGAALAARRRTQEPAHGGILVDVSPLRRSGDNTDADFFADVLPRYLAEQVGPGHSVAARIDSVDYGPAGSGGGANSNRAVDTIQGVGRVDGREFPIQTSLQTFASFPDIGGYAARTRQDQLAQSFAQWLARESGSRR